MKGIKCRTGVWLQRLPQMSNLGPSFLARRFSFASAVKWQAIVVSVD